MRCRAIKGVSDVIVACPDDPYEDTIGLLAESMGAQTFRGSMQDVLARYWGAANLTNCAYVIRVTADCPLLDPGVCGALLENAIAAEADYAGLGRFPHGLDCEVFTKPLLDRAYAEATNPLDREHVTLWMKRRRDLKKISYWPEDGDFHQTNRWVLDYPEDYDFLREVFNLMPKDSEIPGWRRVLDLIDQNPDLRAINQIKVDEWAAKNQTIQKNASTP